jgi:hypothetical protein
MTRLGIFTPLLFLTGCAINGSTVPSPTVAIPTANFQARLHRTTGGTEVAAETGAVTQRFGSGNAAQVGGANGCTVTILGGNVPAGVVGKLVAGDCWVKLRCTDPKLCGPPTEATPATPRPLGGE